MDKPSEAKSPRHSSSPSFLEAEQEKESLLKPDSTLSEVFENGRHSVQKTTECHTSRLYRIIVFLSFLSTALLIALVVVIVQKKALEPMESASWLPPERHSKQIFQYMKIYGSEPSDESEKAWSNLIPRGKGFVIVHNSSAIPDMPGLNQSIAEQHAMVSVFHQLHCLYMTRAGYFAAVSGNLTEVDTGHLSHCWDYLRQTIMCAGDTAMEWLPAPPNDLGSSGWGYQHTCKDYTAIYEWAEKHRLTNRKVIHE